MARRRCSCENKSPRTFADFKRQLAEHSAIGWPIHGSACCASGHRCMTSEMKALNVPTLILIGDETRLACYPAFS